MNWFVASLYWIVTLLGIGLIFLPLSNLILPKSRDRGFAVAVTLGLILIVYTQYVLGTLKILPFVRESLVGIVAVWIIVNLYIYKTYILSKSDAKKGSLLKHVSSWYQAFLTRRLFIIECVIFAGCFFFLAYIRGQEPSIHGLEKFMDFGFINSILRSNYFPPLDMWYGPDLNNPAGYPINYYYFGHLTAAVLIRLTDVSSAIGYNLTLAMILATSTLLSFSLGYQFVQHLTPGKIRDAIHAAVVGILALALVNFAGNFHTIYLFTKGYSPDKPIPFWQIMSGYNPTAYWYPNATRFIPFTIHEFPSYSYVVADLHGHVFDIPFVLVTITLVYHVFSILLKSYTDTKPSHKNTVTASHQPPENMASRYYLVLFGFLLAIHYMTNAFDGPIYLLLLALLFWIANQNVRSWLATMGVIAGSFALFSLPFSAFFKPFASGIGINCAAPLLSLMHATTTQKIGPFLLEVGKCQKTPLWMFFVLWGFYMLSAGLYSWFLWTQHRAKKSLTSVHILFATIYFFSFFLIVIPEFFYAKDIYPDHFRANTMFKLGYQAFILMSLANAYTYWQLKHVLKNRILVLVFALMCVLPLLYPLFSFKSYYGDLNKPPELDGILWLKTTHPEDYELVQYINSTITDRRVVLEAQGDSYTDYNRISSYTGLPTPAGWWVHEWLWRGNADAVGLRSPDVQKIYETQDPNEAMRLLQKYRVSYVVVSRLEREKYLNLSEKKFEQIGRLIFRTSDGFGALYRVN